MAAQIICPNLQCRKMLAVPDEARGKIVRCSGCSGTFKVPFAQPKVFTPPSDLPGASAGK